MIDWILQNKEWIFSGIGIVFLGVIVKFLFRKNKFIKIKEGKRKSYFETLHADRDINITIPMNSNKINLANKNHEQQLAENLITFLENKRIFYTEHFSKCPGGVVDSILKTRTFIQKTLEELPRESELFKLLSMMRNSLLIFLEETCKECKNPTSCMDCTIQGKGCVKHLQSLREEMREPIFKIIDSHNISIKCKLFNEYITS